RARSAPDRLLGRDRERGLRAPLRGLLLPRADALLHDRPARAPPSAARARAGRARAPGDRVNARAAPRLSVVVLSYDRPAMLARALPSVIADAGDDAEVIVVDN